MDIDCGSLRVGKLFIPYLLKGNYTGIEPNKWLVDKAITNEVGRDIINVKDVRLFHFIDFVLSRTNEKFDFINAQSIFSQASASQIIT